MLIKKYIKKKGAMHQLPTLWCLGKKCLCGLEWLVVFRTGSSSIKMRTVTYSSSWQPTDRKRRNLCIVVCSLQEAENIVMKIKQQQYQELLTRDQLNIEKKEHKVFFEYGESTAVFHWLHFSKPILSSDHG